MRADAALAAGLWALEVLLLHTNAVEFGVLTDAWWPLWAALALVPVVIRRRWLWPAVGLTGLSTAAGVFYMPLWTSQGMALWVVAYTLATTEKWWRAVLGSSGLWLIQNMATFAAYQKGWMSLGDGRALVSPSTAMTVNLVTMVVIFMLGRT